MDEITIKEYVDALFHEKEVQLKATSDSLNERLGLLNEFRQQSEDEQKRFVTSAEYDAQHNRLVDDVKLLQSQAIRNSGDYVKRSEFELLGNQVAKSSGTRTALLAGASFLAAIVLAVSGWTIASVSKNTTELNHIEKDQFVQNAKIAQIQTLDKFFCATRIKAGLPAC